MGLTRDLDLAEPCRAIARAPCGRSSQPGLRSRSSRRNVGKSTLVNALAGETRVVVTDIPGTTRDSVDVLLELDGQAVTLIDTAGLRRKAKQDPIDHFGRVRTERSLRRCDVVLFIMDASESISIVDKKVAEYMVEVGKPVILVLNKWDLAKVAGKEPEEYEKYYDEVLPALAFAPIVCLGGQLQHPPARQLAPDLHAVRDARPTSF